MTVATSTPSTPTLDPGQIADFKERGYLVFPGFLPQELTDRLKLEVDACRRDQQPADPYAQQRAADRSQRKLVLEYREHGLLISHPPLMAILTDLLGPGFAFHHIHTARHDAGCKGVHWHHDYEQIPQSNRSHAMVHVFYYLNGLNGEIGDLLVLPGSHRRVMNRDTIGMFGTESVPGTVVIDDLPPGSAVVVHSGVSHARRAKPGGQDRPRYFIDSSYCQAGVRWPSYMDYRVILRRALDLGLDRGGAYAHLFDVNQFFDAEVVGKAFAAQNRGSVFAEGLLQGTG